MKNIGFLLFIIPLLGFGQNDSLNQKRDSVLLNLTGKPELFPPESQRLFRPGVPSLDTRNGKPLFVIDGVVKEEIHSIEEIDQDQIIKITELKGASATALYGSKARNGVFIIETENSISNKLEDQIPRMGITSNEIPGIIQIDSIIIPDQTPSITIQDPKTYNPKNDPIYVLNVNYVEKERIEDLKPENIESIHIIKTDNSIISCRNKNPVIVITTKGSQSPIDKYDLTVLDLGYESFLSMQPSASSYSLNYLENKNNHYVSVWNSRVISGNPDIYDMPIDYNSRTYYGLEFEYKLFMFFKFMEDKHQISMM